MCPCYIKEKMLLLINTKINLLYCHAAHSLQSTSQKIILLAAASCTIIILLSVSHFAKRKVDVVFEITQRGESLRNNVLFGAEL